VLAPGPALAAPGLKFGNRQTHRDAGIAVFAMRAIGKFSAAPEAQLDEAAIGVGINQVMRRGNQRLRLLPWQVAARIVRGGVELQFL
jgi:hypothetical protein